MQARHKDLSYSLFAIMLDERLSFITFVVLTYVPSILSLFHAFVVKKY